jgi:hypothetical protein
MVGPFDAAKRDTWLAEVARRMQHATAGEMLSDILPSLLAHEDRKALALILRAARHKDSVVSEYARYSLTLFDPKLLHSAGE